MNLQREHKMNSFLWNDILHALATGQQRAQWVTSGLVDNLKVTRKLIRYVKCIPGFKDLALEDQIVLVQGEL